MIPFFIDFPYFDPIVDVLREDELKFRSNPQEPQLYEDKDNAV